MESKDRISFEQRFPRIANWVQFTLPKVYDESITLSQAVYNLRSIVYELAVSFDELGKEWDNFIDEMNVYITEEMSAQIKELVDSGKIDDIIIQAIDGKTFIELVESMPVKPFNNTLYYIDKYIDNYSVTKSNRQLEIEYLKSIEEQIARNEFTISSFNFLGCNYWQYPLNPPIPYDLAMYEGYRTMLKSKSSIIGIQEWNTNPFYDGLSKINKNIFPYFIDHKILFPAKGGASLGDGTFSHYTPFEVKELKYTNSDYEGVIKSKYNILGFDVSVYNTHMSVDNSKTTQQVNELLSMINADNTKYKIIIGDLNITYETQKDMLQPIINKGFTNVNTKYGTFVENDAIIDYILVTNNFIVKDYGVIDPKESSDHKLLHATLKFGGVRQ